VLAVAAIGFLPWAVAGGDALPAADAARAVLPTTFADHSYLTAHVADSPAGPAVAVYEYGVGDSLWQTPQVIAIGRDGRSYRELDAAADRGGDYGQQWRQPAPTLLAPDGSKVAVEKGRGPADDIAVVDLTTGKSRRYPVTAGSAVQALAWSPDAAQLVFTIAPYRPDAYGDPRLALTLDGELALLDLASGRITPITGQRGTLDAAFAPDGRRLAVQTASELRIIGLDGVVQRVVPVPTGHRLAGPAAWSPDGAKIAVYRVATGSPGVARGLWSPDGLAVIELSSGTSRPLETDLHSLLGWHGDGVVVHRRDEIARVPQGGGPDERLATLQPGNDHFIIQVQLATKLVPDLRIAEVGVDRGPWPTWLRLLAAAGALGAGITGFVIARVIRRRRHRRGQPRRREA
jgi:dipeptidyl aminopeptidase/acylaminoacyl peptidase